MPSCLLTAFAILLSACGQKEVAETSEPVVRPIKLLIIEEASDQRSRSYPAIVQAATSRDLSFSVGGLIVEIPVKEAQQIKVGDVIARLDTRDFQTKFNSAKAQFDNAEDEYQRSVRLAAGDAIAKSALDQSESQRDVAKATFNAAEKALNDSVLRSPIAGVVSIVSASTSQNITAGTSVATVISVDGLQATINLPASVMATIESRTDRKAVVILDAAPSDQIVATFKEITLEADAATQTFGMTFTFDRPENTIVLPGMSATVVLSSSGSGGASVGVAVPLGSILSDGADQYVWVVDSDSMKVSKRAVTLGNSVGETVVVQDGLTAGETVAAAGAAYLSEGMQVRPWTAQ